MISTAVRRLSPAVSIVALFIALLALVATAAGAGYAAGTIGSKDLKKNAVTAAKIKKNAVTTKKIKKSAVTGDKVKDGSLTVVDLPPNEAQKAAVLSNGGEGDCVWQSGAALLPGLGGPTFRKDRFGTVHLGGVALVQDGLGGDTVCDPFDAGQGADAIAFTLPAAYIPAKTMIVGTGSSGGVIIAGPLGVSGPALGGITLPPGAVASPSGSGGGGLILDGIDFEPVGSSVVIPKMTASGRFNAELLAQVGLG